VRVNPFQFSGCGKGQSRGAYQMLVGVPAGGQGQAIRQTMAADVAEIALGLAGIGPPVAVAQVGDVAQMEERSPPAQAGIGRIFLSLRLSHPL
jgi:hypothetical protein